VKEASDSRTRSNSMGWTRGGKFGIGNDPGVVQSGFSHATYKGIFFECGTFNNLWYNDIRF
jgi:hypothetical protein